MHTGRRRRGGCWEGVWAVVGAGLVGVLLAGGLADAGTTVVWPWAGGGDDHHFGGAVAGVGDVDGDGIPDVVVGAYAGADGAGSVSLLSSAAGRRLWRVEGEALHDQLGYAVAGVGDANGDGIPDVLAGAPFTNPGGRVDAGRAYLLSGKDGQVVWQVEGEAPGDSLGLRVAGVGDVNGDGMPDVAVGAMPLALSMSCRGSMGESCGGWRGSMKATRWAMRWPGLGM